MLGVSPDATTAEIRACYIALARRYHPDFYANHDEGEQAAATERMRDINVAWTVLCNSADRQAYDRQLQRDNERVTPRRTGPVSATKNPKHGASPEPSSGHRPSRLAQVAPVLILVLSLALLAVGFVTGLAGLLAAGLACTIVAGAMFVVVPMITLSRSRAE